VNVNEGPLFGLQLTLNVQHYENLPFSQEDSGFKASWSFTVSKISVNDYFCL